MEKIRRGSGILPCRGQNRQHSSRISPQYESYIHSPSKIAIDNGCARRKYSKRCSQHTWTSTSHKATRCPDSELRHGRMRLTRGPKRRCLIYTDERTGVTRHGASRNCRNNEAQEYDRRGMSEAGRSGVVPVSFFEPREGLAGWGTARFKVGGRQ